MTVQEAIKLAMEHQNAGRLNDAEVLYRQVLTVAPDHPEALHWLGVIAMQCGATEPARKLIARAIELQPQYAEAHCSMGDLLALLNKPQEAADAYERALAIRPGFVEACNNLGTVLKDLGRTEDAIAAYRRAQSLQPNSPQPWCNLSQAMLDLGRDDEALAYAREALARDQAFADAHNNFGAGMLRAGRVDDALASFRRAVELRSDFPLARSNLGMVLLLKGDFPNGWREYEWRLRLTDSFKFRADLSQPQWDGKELAGKRIFLHAEQGFGDVIHFARYIPLVCERGGTVIVGCHPPLKRLLGRIPGVTQCVTRDDPLPEFEVHCPFPSLPAVFETRLDTIPASVPYITADPSLARSWRERLSEERRFKVGLVWAGRPEHTNDRNRSIALATLAPLAGVPGIRWISLQKGQAAAQVKQPPAGMDLSDWSLELNDFDDTAGLIDNLDLVISVDTSAAHLAAAMGKQAWVLLPLAPDWRWMLGRDDSPWYPTLRLFRQQAAGDWAAVIDRVVGELGQFVT